MELGEQVTVARLDNEIFFQRWINKCACTVYPAFIVYNTIIYCTITLPVCVTLTLWAISCTIVLHIWLPLI